MIMEMVGSRAAVSSVNTSAEKNVHVEFLQNQISTTQRNMWYGDSPPDPTRQINFVCTFQISPLTSLTVCQLFLLMAAQSEAGATVPGWQRKDKDIQLPQTHVAFVWSDYIRLKDTKMWNSQPVQKSRADWADLMDVSSSVSAGLAGCWIPWKVRPFASRDGHKMDTKSDTMEIWETLS